MAESTMTVVYAVLASAALLLVFAALVWTRTIDGGVDGLVLFESVLRRMTVGAV